MEIFRVVMKIFEIDLMFQNQMRVEKCIVRFFCPPIDILYFNIIIIDRIYHFCFSPDSTNISYSLYENSS